MNNISDQETRKNIIDTVPIRTNSKLLQKQELPHDSNRNAGKRKPCCSGCGCFVVAIIFLFCYFLIPYTSRFLLLGIDRAPIGTMAGRSDTIMAVSVNPLIPIVKILSIPRDLWVPIPDYGENRINAAHFFGEVQEPGKGPESAIKTVNNNFGFNLHYFVRINLENFPVVVDALGGITLSLSQQMSGYPSGTYHLNGSQALAFVRSRSDGDDFFRMRQGQVFAAGFIRSLINPANWHRLPQLIIALPKAIDTNIPIWLLPRLGLALIRANFMGMESLVIDRSMVTPTITSEGAQILIPNWDAINSYVAENF